MKPRMKSALAAVKMSPSSLATKVSKSSGTICLASVLACSISRLGAMVETLAAMTKATRSTFVVRTRTSMGAFILATASLVSP